MCRTLACRGSIAALLILQWPLAVAAPVNRPMEGDTQKSQVFSAANTEQRSILLDKRSKLRRLAKGVLKSAYLNTFDVAQDSVLPNTLLSIELAKVLSEIDRINLALETDKTAPIADIAAKDLPNTLEKLVAKLDSSDPTTELPEQAGFAPRNHPDKFPWPINGDIFSTPGTSFRDGGARWPGILITANDGAEVQSIAAGKVVYAGRLKSLGLLVIVDHEDGHLSLYGRNSRILVSQGDRINKQHPIATIANTDHETRAGLYFEIRRDGKPIDPRMVCSNETEVNH